MEAYRDQYATLFNNGKGVTVIGISVDPDTTLHNWARDSHFPILFASDTTGAVGKMYNARRGEMDDRSLFVVGKDGRITYVARPFQIMSQDAYARLAEEVRKAGN
jgi:peroxiredoxin Q/BCP